MYYFDYNATTPVLPEVFEALKPYFCEKWGNPSASYSFGDIAAEAVEEARSQVAGLIGAQSDEIFFTSCATESNQTIVNGTGGCILCSTVEHSSINDLVKVREAALLVSVNELGELDLDQLDLYLTLHDVKLVSVMWANNETGVISPVAEIARLCRAHDVLFHSDAVQAAGKVSVDVSEIDVDYLSLSAHKIYGPKGIGALYVRDGSPFKSMLMGSQEKSKRGGTESVPLVVGFGKAAAIAKKEMSERVDASKAMRDMLECGILEQVPGAYVNGATDRRLPNTSNIGFRGHDSDILIKLLERQDVMVSTGSACKSSAITPSHVLTAMGRSHDDANEAIRFSVSHLTTKAEVDHVVSTIAEVVGSL